MFYKFNSEEHFLSFIASGVLDESDGKILTSVLGKIPSGEFIREVNEEGEETGNQSELFLEGYHVNIKGEVPEQLKQFEVFPEKPFRIFG